MRIGIAILSGALALSATCASALALENPLVTQLRAVGTSGLTGNATFMQLGSDVNVGVNLDKDVTTAAADVRSGSCAKPGPQERFPLVAVNGANQSTRLGHTSLVQLVGKIIVVHKNGSETSPVVACGEIKG